MPKPPPKPVRRAAAPVEVKRGRGRPAGSTNKPKAPEPPVRPARAPVAAVKTPPAKVVKAPPAKAPTKPKKIDYGALMPPGWEITTLTGANDKAGHVGFAYHPDKDEYCFVQFYVDKEGETKRTTPLVPWQKDYDAALTDMIVNFAKGKAVETDDEHTDEEQLEDEMPSEEDEVFDDEEGSLDPEADDFEADEIDVEPAPRKRRAAAVVDEEPDEIEDDDLQYTDDDD